jgi:cysteine desulfurase/selenocysteine lyase
MYGPTGIGVLYGKEKWLEKLPPYQGGGDMIKSVSFEKTEFADLPLKFEAGTPNIAGVIGMGAAFDYLSVIDFDRMNAYENELLNYATQQLKSIPGLRIIGEAKHKAPVISFELENIHPHDIGSIVAHDGICIRAGHHCAMPVMKFFNVAATARASFSFYNTFQEIDALVASLFRVKELFDR